MIVEHKDKMLGYVESWSDDYYNVIIRRDVALAGHSPERIIVETVRKWKFSDIKRKWK